jgi:hypothetical protein
MPAMVVVGAEVVAVVGAGATGVTVAGVTLRGTTAWAGEVTLGVVLTVWRAVVGGAVAVGAGAVVAGGAVVGGAVAAIVVLQRRHGAATAVDPVPAAATATEARKARAKAAATALIRIPDRRLTPNSVAGAAAAMQDRALDWSWLRSPGRHGRQDDEVAGEQQRRVGGVR